MWGVVILSNEILMVLSTNSKENFWILWRKCDGMEILCWGARRQTSTIDSKVAEEVSPMWRTMWGIFKEVSRGIMDDGSIFRFGRKFTEAKLEMAWAPAARAQKVKEERGSKIEVNWSRMAWREEEVDEGGETKWNVMTYVRESKTAWKSLVVVYGIAMLARERQTASNVS